jgi:hypothetical protein
MTDEPVPVVGDQLSTAIQTGVNIAGSATVGSLRSDQFVFFVAFDGTNNDRSNLSYSGDPYSTNVGQLFGQVEAQFSTSTNMAGRYYPGPGTDGTLTASSWLSPAVTEQVIATAVQAYNDFALAAATWLDAHPGGPVTTALTAFSRGGASAAIFSQLLYERGLIDPRNDRVLIAPGEVGVSAGVIFDPVMTGVPGNLAFAPNVSNVVVIRAADEYRYLFMAADYDSQPGVKTFMFTGNHCDIGGGYDRGLSSLTLDATTKFFQGSGLLISDVPPDRLFVPSEAVIHSEGVRKPDPNLPDVTPAGGFYEYPSSNGRLTHQVATPAIQETLDDGSSVVSFVNVRGVNITRTQFPLDVETTADDAGTHTLTLARTVTATTDAQSNSSSMEVFSSTQVDRNPDGSIYRVETHWTNSATNNSLNRVYIFRPDQTVLSQETTVSLANLEVLP